MKSIAAPDQHQKYHAPVHKRRLLRLFWQGECRDVAAGKITDEIPKVIAILNLGKKPPCRKNYHRLFQLLQLRKDFVEHIVCSILITGSNQEYHRVSSYQIVCGICPF